MNRRDPRIQQTLNHLSTRLESANQNAQTSLVSFTRTYLAPCISSFNACLESSCYPCIGARRDRLHARQNRLERAGRARPELVFDFYNDAWDNDAEEEDERYGNGGGGGGGILAGWGNDELDRLLAGSAGGGTKQRPMSYGTRGGRRKSSGEVDPTVLPGSSIFGFLERLPWDMGRRDVKYRPSAADLQEHPGRKAMTEGETALLGDDEDDRGAEGEDDEAEARVKRHQRNRSDTSTSHSTTNSLSSRGDLFPSEDEDDAIPLGDEFATALVRRNTPGAEDGSSGRTSGKTSRSRRKTANVPRSTSLRTTSSRDMKSMRSANADDRLFSTDNLVAVGGEAEQEEQKADYKQHLHHEYQNKDKEDERNQEQKQDHKSHSNRREDMAEIARRGCNGNNSSLPQAPNAIFVSPIDASRIPDTTSSSSVPLPSPSPPPSLQPPLRPLPPLPPLESSPPHAGEQEVQQQDENQNADQDADQDERQEQDQEEEEVEEEEPTP